MPKRSYPFSESFSSQYKVHVGQKQINNCGAFGLKYRQEVYEKTKNLLFNGTKAMMGRIWKADALVSGPAAVSPAPGPQTLLKGQTRIGLDGRLQRASAAPGCAAAPSACCVCQRVSGLRKPCSQCERPACAACIRQCNICSDRCCSLCTITDYSERYERVLCCGCSS
ncbi:apoptosis regulatory protein Siva-like [Sinocyclocheilus anshuiensis]|uniref:Apoptosis regulatory protein Siva-like n=1 Tax=Sinocyclocheilus anshuiensis TaxID=1608454 RepID=A0A671NUE5_9TELE|nr:PREDICTED: apoptosis regulatory protein Siva-like [Sinocyclocheilus anshuiensis]